MSVYFVLLDVSNKLITRQPVQNHTVSEFMEGVKPNLCLKEWKYGLYLQLQEQKNSPKKQV